MHAGNMFRDCRLARMSDGHYCFVRDLGPVKGGKGMKHHEVVLDLNRRGIATFVRRAFAGLRERESSQPVNARLSAGEPSAIRLAASQIKKP
jgi:hypothetical protein